MEKTFITKLSNHRVGESVKVYERDGSVFVVLEPGMSYDAESVNPETLYARWSEVSWEPKDKISFINRTNWHEPERGRWVLKMLNESESEAEFRTIGGEVRQVPIEDPLKAITTGDGVKHKPMTNAVVGGQRVCLPKGIPVQVSCPLTSDLIMFQSLTIIRKKIQVKSADFVGYLVHRWVVHDETPPRPDSELKALGKILDEVGKEKS